MKLNFINNKEKDSRIIIESIINAYKYDDDFSREFLNGDIFKPILH